MYQVVQKLIDEGIEVTRLVWLRLDHPLLMRVELDHLIRWAEMATHASPEQPVFMFLDELTYARDWDRWLKTYHDDQRPVRIVGTSSSALDLRTRRAESGVGRWDEQYLAPYLFSEYLDLLNVETVRDVYPTLAETVETHVRAMPRTVELERHRRRFSLVGGFPELLLAAGEDTTEVNILLDSQRRLRNDAIERTIYKDIPQAVGVQSPELLERLLYVLGGHVGGIISPQNLCQEVRGLSQPTFDRYLGYLERSFLVFTLQNYAGTEGARQRRGRKLYFVDGAVRNAALQRGLTPLNDPAEMGVLIENLAASHLHALSQQTSVRVYYWRDSSSRLEVDLVYDHPQRPMAFEIASSAGHRQDGLVAFARANPRFQNGCYLVAPGLLPSLPKNGAPGRLPLELFLLLVGKKAESELMARLGVSG